MRRELDSAFTSNKRLVDDTFDGGLPASTTQLTRFGSLNASNSIPKVVDRFRPNRCPQAMRSKHVALAVLLVCTGTRAERERVWELSAPSYESVEQPLPGLVSVHSAEGRVRFVLQGSMGSMIECISEAPAALRCAKKGESAPEPNTTVVGPAMPDAVDAASLDAFADAVRDVDFEFRVGSSSDPVSMHSSAGGLHAILCDDDGRWWATGRLDSSASEVRSITAAIALRPSEPGVDWLGVRFFTVVEGDEGHGNNGSGWYRFTLVAVERDSGQVLARTPLGSASWSRAVTDEGFHLGFQTRVKCVTDVDTAGVVTLRESDGSSTDPRERAEKQSKEQGLSTDVRGLMSICERPRGAQGSRL